jgi:hypothetical protein
VETHNVQDHNNNILTIPNLVYPPGLEVAKSPVRVAAIVVAFCAALSAQVAGLRLLSIAKGRMDIREAAAPVSRPRFDLPRNRLIFDQMSVHLAVEIGFDFDDDVFRINGLLNPDIQVSQGATVTITLVGLGGSGSFALAPVPPKVGKELELRGIAGPLGGKVVKWGQAMAILPPHHRGSQSFDIVVATYIADSPGVTYWSDGSGVNGCYGRILVMP